MNRQTEKIKGIINGSGGQDDFTEALTRIVGAKKQYNIITQIQVAAADCGAPVGPVTLGDVIMRDQHERILQWGDKAYKLSEKQVAVIVRECWNYLRD